MRIIVSSLALRNALNKLVDRVDSIICKGAGDSTEVRLCAGEYYAAFYCISHDPIPFIDQANRRWDWIKELVNQINDEPIVLDISEKNVNITLSY